MLFYCLTLLAQTSTDPKNQQSIPLDSIILIGMLMVIIFVIMRSTARRSIKSRNITSQSYKDIANRQLKENPYHTIERLEELMAALADMSREINGQIDTRTAKLEILLAQTDRNIEKYKDFIRQEELRTSQRQNLQQLDTTIDTNLDINELKHDINTENQEKDNLNKYANNNNDSSKDKTPEYPGSSGTVDFRVTDDDNPPKEKTEPDSDRSNFLEKEQIIILAQKGLPMSDISRITGRPSGEIELILNLSGFKGKK